MSEEFCYYFFPDNLEESLMIDNISKIMEKSALLDAVDPVIFWLVDTKCVWVVPKYSFIYWAILKDYPNQKKATLQQVKEVALSLMLDIDEYY